MKNKPQHDKHIEIKRFFRNLYKAKTYYGSAHTLHVGDYRLEKYYKQYKERGFDDSETWDYTTMSDFILPRLKRLKEIQMNGAGETFYDGGYPSEFESSEGKEWWGILDKMIFAFERISNPIDFAIDDIESEKKMETKIQEGLNLFGKYFMKLWWLAPFMLFFGNYILLLPASLNS